jgi:hypothetical protein
VKRLFLTLTLVGLFAASCGGEAVWPSTSSSTSTSEATTTSGVTSTTVEAGAGDLTSQVDDLIAITEEVRGHPLLQPVQVTILSPEDMAARVRANVADELDPEELAIEGAFTRLLGILPAGVDLASVVEDLYAEQVAGFYDFDTSELVVASADQLTPLGRTILVHELVHALADQHFGLGDSLTALVDAGKDHQAAALTALAEGDATYFQLVYMQDYLSPEDQLAAINESLQADTSVLDSLPNWVGEDLAFPYEWGFGFVERLVQDGGIAAVDQAYERPPTTVEQIMHPTAYFTLEPALAVALPATALEGYEVAEEGEFGEWNLHLYLLNGIGDGDATVAASGWGGDAYRIHWNGSQVAFAYLYEGDTSRDAEELEPALIDSLKATMAVGAPVTDSAAGSTTLEGANYAFVQRSGSSVLVVIADDPAAGRSLAAQLQLEPQE